MGSLKITNKDGVIITWIVNGVDLLETGLAEKCLMYEKIGQVSYTLDKHGHKIMNEDIDDKQNEKLIEQEVERYKFGLSLVDFLEKQDKEKEQFRLFMKELRK